MHVFIDTNILLRFFHFTEEELDALSDVFASHEHGSAIVHLTEQVRDEFARNREGKIKDALKKFREGRQVPQLPAFLKGYEEYGEIRELTTQILDKRKSILGKVDRDIKGKQLPADRLLEGIFQSSELTSVSEENFQHAARRMAVGNPPGKKGSLGDAINWEILLESLPSNEDIHVISVDGDFYSPIYENSPHNFLSEEWSRRNGGTLFVYRSLSAFMKEHFDGIAFSFDKEKEALIEELAHSGSYSTTHALVAQLEHYNYFSLREAMRILEAAAHNTQFGHVVCDHDVAMFLARIAGPHISNIPPGRGLTLLQDAIQSLGEE